MELVEKEPNCLGQMDQEFDVPPEEYEELAQVSARVPIGKNTYNRTSWTIKKIITNAAGDPTHAVIQTLPDASFKRRKYQQKGRELVHVPDDGSDEGKTRVVPIDKVMKLMNKPYDQMMAGGDMGMGAPPGGDMGMGAPPGGPPMM